MAIDFSYLHGQDVLDLYQHYPNAYHFLLRRTLRNELTHLRALHAIAARDHSGRSNLKPYFEDQLVALEGLDAQHTLDDPVLPGASVLSRGAADA